MQSVQAWGMTRSIRKEKKNSLCKTESSEIKEVCEPYLKTQTNRYYRKKGFLLESTGSQLQIQWFTWKRLTFGIELIEVSDGAGHWPFMPSSTQRVPALTGSGVRLGQDRGGTLPRLTKGLASNSVWELELPLLSFLTPGLDKYPSLTKSPNR